MEGKNITIFKKVINIKKKDMDSSCYIVLESYEEKMLLTNALSYVANNTIEQMTKCKDIIEMNESRYEHAKNITKVLAPAKKKDLKQFKKQKESKARRPEDIIEG